MEYGRRTRVTRTVSEEDLTQADVAFMFADCEDTASLPATNTDTTTATTTAITTTATTTATTTTTTAPAAAVPSRTARRAPRATPNLPPPDLPATASEVTDVASLSRVVTLLSAAIQKAVYTGKSVTTGNKRLISCAAEEIRRATDALVRASPTEPQPSSTPPTTTPVPTDGANNSFRRELAACVREEFSKLKAELTGDVRRAAARAPSGPTYAQMARTQPLPSHQQQQQQQQQRHTPAPANIPPPPPRVTRPAIVVSTKAQVTSRQQAVEAFRRSISFRESNYAPARVQPVSHGKLRVEFDTDQQRDDALLRLNDASEVTAEPARTQKPMLILKGISKSTPLDELVDIVRRQNNCTDGELALKFERKNRNVNLYSAVLVASPNVWRRLVDMGRVYVDHQRVHVERFSPFVQCFACLQFGHVRKNCVSSAPKPCACCASSAHQEPDCPEKNDKIKFKCYNCVNRNEKFNNTDPVNHKATSGFCSVARAMRARVESRVDYGTC